MSRKKFISLIYIAPFYVGINTTESKKLVRMSELVTDSTMVHKKAAAFRWRFVSCFVKKTNNQTNIQCNGKSTYFQKILRIERKFHKSDLHLNSQQSNCTTVLLLWDLKYLDQRATVESSFSWRRLNSLNLCAVAKAMFAW